MSEEQQARYEAYRRSKFPKAAVKRVMYSLSYDEVVPQELTRLLGHQVGELTAVAVAGATRVFVGELMEEGNSHKSCSQ